MFLGGGNAQVGALLTRGDEVRALLVDDDDDGFVLTRSRLDRIRHLRFRIERASGDEEGLARLHGAAFDICLVAERDGRGMAFLRAARSREVPVPIVMLAAEPCLEADLEAMALGVADFLDEDHVDDVLLERAVRYALARRRQADRLSRLARQDQLTGLANRTLLQDRLERALAWARRNDRLVAVMILDLNGFKQVNDGLGHAAGDRLLCVMAERLQGRLRETDTVARTGGDEFALVIENLARPEHAALVARKLLDAVAPPVLLGDREVRVTASLGIALYPDDADAPADLQGAADAAMYRAKAEGGNLYRFANPALERSVQRGALLASDLRRGLLAGEFVLHFQPQIALVPGEVGIAALPFWRHAELGLIAPDRFLPLAEASGLTDLLMAWMVDAAIDQLAAWRRFELDQLHLALPLLVRRQLQWSDLTGMVEQRLQPAGVPPRAIEIEVDEARLLADLDGGGAGLKWLRAAGLRLALDAFGSGVTSLRGFQSGAIDTIKLDRVLLQGIPADAPQTATVTAILELARHLGIRCVATGAESQAQVAFLRHHDCSAVQAFMSCPPLPADACARWLEQAAARRDAAPVLPIAAAPRAAPAPTPT